MKAKNEFLSTVASELAQAARSQFNVDIDDGKCCVVADRGISIAVAPIKGAMLSEKGAFTFAVLHVLNVATKNKRLMPVGTYLLNRKGRTSRLIDNENSTIVTGDVHAAPKSITRMRDDETIITIGGGKVCIYWYDDPKSKNPQCHCHCFRYRKEPVETN